MLLIIGRIFFFILIISSARAQSINKFGFFDTSTETNSTPLDNELISNNSFIALEKSVSPIDYIIGPGDILGININTMEKMFFSAPVGPAGDLLIPGVGSVQIAGLSLNSSITSIKNRILRTFKNADIDISLISLKSFKVQLFGALNEPGFATIQAFTRLDRAVSLAGGLHREADEERILIKNKNGDSNFVNIKYYLLNGDLNHNPILNEGDRVKVFFKPNSDSKSIIGLTIKKTPILVSGFVNTPGPLKYFPGYNVIDYIGLAGGISEIGSTRKIFLIRNSKKILISESELVLPGDQIHVPEGTFSVVFGKNSFLQNITALFSIISTYTVISERINNN